MKLFNKVLSAMKRMKARCSLLLSKHNINDASEMSNNNRIIYYSEMPTSDNVVICTDVFLNNEDGKVYYTLKRPKK